MPRLLWFTVYLSLCFMAYKGMTYFSKSLVNMCASVLEISVLLDCMTFIQKHEPQILYKSGFYLAKLGSPIWVASLYMFYEAR